MNAQPVAATSPQSHAGHAHAAASAAREGATAGTWQPKREVRFVSFAKKNEHDPMLLKSNIIIDPQESARTQSDVDRWSPPELAHRKTQINIAQRVFD